MNRYGFSSTWMKPDLLQTFPVEQGQLWSRNGDSSHFYVQAGKFGGGVFNPKFEWNLVSPKGSYTQESHWLTEIEIKQEFTRYE
jgi:hypothetical protein